MSEVTCCPECGSDDVLHNPKRNDYRCEGCGHRFTLEKPFVAKRVFISYGHDEHMALALRLREDLKKRGHDVWFDADRLPPGQDWELNIEKGLEWAAADKANAAVILLLTPYSVRRPDGYCLNEVARALSRGLQIIPVMVVESEPPLSICRIQWLDMKECIPIHEKGEQYQLKFERLLKALEEDHLDFEGTQQRLLKYLRPLEFDTDILNHVEKFTGRQWVFNAIRQWLDEPPEQRVFWICGGPGVGKTALSAILSSRYREVVALHLCKFGHAQKSDPRSVVTSIVYQLSTQLPDYEARLARMDLEVLTKDDATTMFDNLLVQPFSKLNTPDRAIVILIDALDEATTDGYNQLAAFVANEFSKTPDWLRLIITSRPENAVTSPLHGLNPFVLNTETEDNREDIRNYIRRELETQFQKRIDAKSIVEQVLDRSEGVFLYVERVCHDVRSGLLSLDRLNEFPRGLSGIFLQFFNRLVWIDDKDKPRPDYERYRGEFRPALRAIFAARDPLPTEILQRLFDWKEEELQDFTRTLGSLFPVTRESGAEVIKLYHKSLADWLADETKAGPYFVSVVEGHRLLAERGWQCYVTSIFTIPHYFLTHLPFHLFETGQTENFCTLVSTPEYAHSVREAGGIVELLRYCDELIEEGNVFSVDQRDKIMSWLQSTPEDTLGQRYHERWFQDMGNRPNDSPIVVANRERLQPWRDLPRRYRVVEWRHVSEVFGMLNRQGFEVLPASSPTSPPISFTCEEVERLAEEEHERWCRERIADGWTYAPTKDIERRTSPYLVPWEEMNEDVKEYDRYASRALPRLLAEGGYKIFRVAEGVPQLGHNL